MDQPKNVAEIILHPTRFQIKGPGVLVAKTQIAISSTTDPETAKYLVMDVWEDWYVQCSISGEWVSLAKLYYWDVEKNEVYARPELVPGLGWYVKIPGLEDDKNISPHIL